MASWYRATFPFILTLSLALAQSGGGGDDDPFEFCYSTVRIKQVNFICQLEDDLVGEVIAANLCHTNLRPVKCIATSPEGKSIVFKNLHVFTTYSLEVNFNRSEPFTRQYVMTKIIKPDPPRISNATFVTRDNQAIIAIENGYSGDYLHKKLKFDVQLRDGIKAKEYEILQENLIIEGMYLKENTEYRVQARMIPYGDYFNGYWSDWGPSSHFHTPKEMHSTRLRRPKPSLWVYVFIFVPLILFMILALGVLRWHKEIRSVIWPSIPNPKNILVQGYKPKKGPPVSFNPEAFIDNNIHLIDRVEETRAVPDILERSGSFEFRGHGSSGWCSGPSPRSSNGGAGESQPMLQSKSRGDKEGLEGDKLVPSPVIPGNPGNPGSSGRSSGNSDISDAAKSVPVPRREEAYVTMSSFYKTQ